MRIISCSENEIPDPDIPPHLSGCHENDKAGFAAFENRFLDLIQPVHARFNAFLETIEHEPYPLGEFFEASPTMNLLLYPKPLAFKRRRPLDPQQFQYLEGCVRQEKPLATMISSWAAFSTAGSRRSPAISTETAYLSAS